MRSLLDVVLTEAGDGTMEPGTRALLPLDSRMRGPRGADPVLCGPLPAAGVALARSAAEVSALGLGMRTLALVAQGNETLRVVALVDGWLLLRGHGAGMDLRGADLRGADLTGARLTGADLTGADLSGSHLESADLARTVLRSADLSGASLRRASLFGADLTEADLRRTDLRHSDLRQCTCARTAFRGADFWSAYVWDVPFDEAFTEGADIERADYRGTHLPKPENARV
ncbi:pentapeptide repeat-containing protein [Streptomyces sp. NPDC002809]|uniref:pentapeptide repeat-containing protein n=1 Tax=Streptomyces sp. NPDC002809 TaxID=3154433 RepID=UPI00332A806D